MNSKPKKRKNRRKQAKYPALRKEFTPRVRQEFLDYDYLDQLNDAEKAWLDKFTEEWLNASFKHDGTDIQSYEKYGKDANDRNNARNRCLYGMLKNKDDKFRNKKLLNYENIIHDIEVELSREVNPTYVEDAYVNFLEKTELVDMMAEYNQAMKNFTEEPSEDLSQYRLLMPECQES